MKFSGKSNKQSQESIIKLVGKDTNGKTKSFSAIAAAAVISTCYHHQRRSLMTPVNP